MVPGYRTRDTQVGRQGKVGLACGLQCAGLVQSRPRRAWIVGECLDDLAVQFGRLARFAQLPESPGESSFGAKPDGRIGRGLGQPGGTAGTSAVAWLLAK